MCPATRHADRLFSIATGFPYPVPWKEIPVNVYFYIRMIHKALNFSKLKKLRAAGIEDPVSPISLMQAGVPWISVHTDGASLQLEVVPEEAKAVGPIVLSSAPAEEQDAELAAWTHRARTIFINLGSHFQVRPMSRRSPQLGDR
jgi:hypothetical protein